MKKGSKLSEESRKKISETVKERIKNDSKYKEAILVASKKGLENTRAKILDMTFSDWWESKCLIFNDDPSIIDSFDETYRNILLEKFENEKDRVNEKKSEGGKIGAAAINKKRKEEGTLHDHTKMMRSNVTPEGKQKMLDTWERIIHAPRTEKQLKALSDIGKKYGKQNGETYGRKSLLSFTPEERIKYASIGGNSGGAKKAVERGTHNWISQSPNKVKVMCPDGHITSKPSATAYCRHRNLDLSKIRILSEEEYNNLKQ